MRFTINGLGTSIGNVILLDTLEMENLIRLVLCLCSVWFMAGCARQVPSENDFSNLPDRPLTAAEAKKAWFLARDSSSPQLDLAWKLEKFELEQPSLTHANESRFLAISEGIRLQKEFGVHRDVSKGLTKLEIRSLTERLINNAKLPSDKSVEIWVDTKELSEVDSLEIEIREAIVKKLKAEDFIGVSNQLAEVKFLREVGKTIDPEWRKRKSRSPNR